MHKDEIDAYFKNAKGFFCDLGNFIQKRKIYTKNEQKKKIVQNVAKLF